MVKEQVQGAIDRSIEAIQDGSAIIRHTGIVQDWIDGGCRQRRVDPVEELEEKNADPEAFGGEAINLGALDLLNKALGAELCQVVAQPGEGVGFDRLAERFGGGLVQIRCPEAVPLGQVRESSQRLHDRQKPRIVDLEAGGPPAAGE